MLGAGECAVNPLRRRPDGWRTIKVGQLELWWTTSEPRVAAQLATMQTAYSVTLTVVRSDGSGQKLVAALVKAANELAWDADFQAQFLAKADKRIAQLEKSLGLPSPAECLAQWEAQWEAEEDGRAFLETCAAEHSFRDILA